MDILITENEIIIQDEDTLYGAIYTEDDDMDDCFSLADLEYDVDA